MNQARARKPRAEQNWVAPEWGWAWPTNRRIIYNRASADPDGKPWSERKRYVWWDAEQGKWTGPGTSPDFPPTKAPDYEPPRGRQGAGRASRGDEPFIMQADGKGWLYAPSGLVDGPLPTHYEPQESPFDNPLYAPAAQPGAAGVRRPRTRYHPPRRAGREVFPFVLTTYRLTEHHTAGGMRRTVPFLAELQPEFFCEVSPELAGRARPRARRLGDDRHRARGRSRRE